MFLQICIDEDEIESARWFSREEVATALALSQSDPIPWFNRDKEAPPPPLLVPPSLTIAHRLMKLWLATTS